MYKCFINLIDVPSCTTKVQITMANRVRHNCGQSFLGKNDEEEKNKGNKKTATLKGGQVKHCNNFHHEGSITYRPHISLKMFQK